MTDPAALAVAGGERPPIRRIDDLLRCEPDERARMLATMSDKDCEKILCDWNLWARPDQEPPPGDWIVWLILAGRGAGKTRAGAEAVRRWSWNFPFVNLIGPTADDVRDVMVLGEFGHSQLLPRRRAAALPRLGRKARVAERRGEPALLGRGARPAARQAAHEAVVRRTRRVAPARGFRSGHVRPELGTKPQMIVTTTPRPTRIVKALAADKDTIVTRGSTFDNRSHLAGAFLKRIARRYEGRVIGRQELFAEIIEDAPGALWTRALIERQRVAPEVAPREFSEVVVAIDPPARSGSKADECGLVVAGKAADGKLYVLADLTSQGDSPAGWAARAGAAYRGFGANRVVAEINNGGEMVTEVLRHAEPHLPVRTVTATRGKFLRAEPIAAAYERGLVLHAGVFAKLEDQLCALTPDFDRRSGPSPDRADALVWAISDLLGLDRANTGMLDYWAGQARQANPAGAWV